MVSIEKKTADTELESMIINHITQNNIELCKIVKSDHMGEVERIKNYMMFLVSDLRDARALNYAFNMALKDLKIDLASMLKPVTKKVGTMRIAG